MSTNTTTAPTPAETGDPAADVTRLRALIAEVVTCAIAAQTRRWMPDDLWDRLTAETPTPPEPERPAPADDPSLF